MLKLKAEYPDARLVIGNTEVGIEMKFKDARYPVLIGVTHVPELNHIEVSRSVLLGPARAGPALPCLALPCQPSPYLRPCGGLKCARFLQLCARLKVHA